MTQHTHDTDGGSTDNTIRVGDENVTYTKVKCSCGAVVSNTITNREKAN